MTAKLAKMGVLVCIAPGNDIDKSGHMSTQGSADRIVEPNKKERLLTAIAQNLIKTSEEFFLGKGILDEEK